MMMHLLCTNKVDIDDNVPRLQCMTVPLFFTVSLISSPKVVMFPDIIISGSSNTPSALSLSVVPPLPNWNCTIDG